MPPVIKRFLYFFLFAVVPVFVLFIVKSNYDQAKYDEYIRKFDLKFTGVIVKKTDMENHNTAYLLIRLTSSNKKEYSDYNCKVHNNFAYMYSGFCHCLRAGDTVIVGPNDRFIIKSGNDTVLVSPGGVDNCYRMGRK